MFGRVSPQHLTSKDGLIEEKSLVNHCHKLLTYTYTTPASKKHIHIITFLHRQMICVYIYIYIDIHMYIYICIYPCISMYRYILHRYILIFIYIYIYTTHRPQQALGNTMALPPLKSLRMVVLERQTRRPWGDQPMPEAWRDEVRFRSPMEFQDFSQWNFLVPLIGGG